MANFQIKVGASHLTGREWRTVILASIGGAVEYYDLIVFPTFASFISAEIFPSSDGTASLLNTFLVFAIGYLIRPVGGVVFGTLGDRLGRRTIFIFTLLVISLSTIAMGLTPGYARIGVLAPIIFVVLRVCQGLCYGGEGAGVFTYCTEVAPQRAGLACGIIYFMNITGVVLANAFSGAISKYLPAADAAAYGWRLAFVLGGVLGLLALAVRRNLEESPEFLNMRSAVVRSPLLVLLRQYPVQLLTGVCLVAPLAISGGLLFAHLPAYLARFADYPPTIVPMVIMTGSVVMALCSVLYGWISDFGGRIPLYRLGSLFFIIGAWPVYSWLAHKSASPFVIIAVATAGAALITGTLGPLIAGLFPTEVRFTGYGFCYNIGNALFQSVSPLLATYLIVSTGNLTAPSFVWIGAGVIGVLASLGPLMLDERKKLAATEQEAEISPSPAVNFR